MKEFIDNSVLPVMFILFLIALAVGAIGGFIFLVKWIG
jgi:hypothetical protein